MYPEKLPRLHPDDAASRGEILTPLILIGFPTVGKTYYGHLVAKALDCPFFDLDEVLSMREGKKPQEIYRVFGEEYFRTCEEKALESLTLSGAFVLATGGGTILSVKNRSTLRSLGRVIFLTLPKVELEKRLFAKEKRAVVPTKEIWESTYIQRLPLYRETAHHTLAIERQSEEGLVEELVRYAQAAVNCHHYGE